jgi:hypothetical protein
MRMGFRSWKQLQRARWRQLSWQRQSGWLVGIIALGATMTAISATQVEPSYWQGFMTGVWGSGTVMVIGFLVAIQISARNR